jgi:hypothetical protein
MAFCVVRTRRGRRGSVGGYDDGVGSRIGCQGSSFRAVRYSAPLDNPATATTTATTTSQSRLNLKNEKKKHENQKKNKKQKQNFFSKFSLFTFDEIHLNLSRNKTFSRVDTDFKRK